MDGLQHSSGQQSANESSSYVCFDKDGFLLESANWTEETAAMIAEIDGVGPLRAEHWQVILFFAGPVPQVGCDPSDKKY